MLRSPLPRKRALRRQLAGVGSQRLGDVELAPAVDRVAGTDFEDTSADDFFANAVGRIAQVKGTVSGGVFTAREVEFEND